MRALLGVAALLGGCLRLPGSDVPDHSSDAAPSGAADASGGDAPAAPTDLLVNGDFDLGAVSWTLGGTSPRIVDGATAMLTPDSGEFVAELGRSNSDLEWLRETVDVPPWTAELRIDGKECIATIETAADPVDTCQVLLLRNGEVLESLRDRSNLDGAAACTWAPFEAVATMPYAGQTITLELIATTDATNPTTCYLDTLTLTASP
jgi:hypothetical protein